MQYAYQLNKICKNISNVALVIGDVHITSDIDCNQSSDETVKINLTSQEVAILRSTMNNTRNVNLEPLFKQKLAANILAAAKFNEVAIINGFETKPDMIVHNAKEDHTSQLGRPHKLYGAGIKKHVVIPVSFDSITNCYTCVASSLIKDVDSDKQHRVIKVHKYRLIKDYTLRSVANYLKFGQMNS